jgi:hypothetical protein
LQFQSLAAQFFPGVLSGSHPNLYFRSDNARVEVMDYSSSFTQIPKISVAIETESGDEAIKILGMPPDLIGGMSFGVYCVRDTVFLTTYERANWTIRLYSTSVFSDMKTFEFIGSYEHDKQNALFGRFGIEPGWIIPYKNNKYLFVLKDIYNYKPEDKNGVKFIEASLTDKKFVFNNYICVNFDGQDLLRDGSGTRSVPIFSGIHDAWVSYKPILLDGYLVLVSKLTGVFWILDTEKGTIRQKKLYKELDNANIFINPIIANVCLSPDGSIIIAARPKKNAFVEVDESTSKNMEGRSPDEQSGIRQKWQEDNLLKYPQIEWWKLDVKDGTFSPMVQPPGDVPSIIETGTKWFQFKFRVHPDGRVTMVKSPSFG